MLTDFLIKIVTAALCHLLDTNVDGLVENLEWEVKLHQVLDDSENYYLALGQAAHQ